MRWRLEMRSSVAKMRVIVGNKKDEEVRAE